MFGVELSKKIKLWIEQGEQRINYIPENTINHISNNDLDRFLEENQLTQLEIEL